MTEATHPAIKIGGLDEGVNKKKKPKITVGNPTISKIIPRVFPCSSISIITHSTPNFPLTKSFNVKTYKTLKMKIQTILLYVPPIGFLFIGAWFFFQFLVCDVTRNCPETSYYLALVITLFILFYAIPAGGYLTYRKIKSRRQEKK